MVIVLDKKTDWTKLEKQLKKVVANRRVTDKKKFFGKIKWSVDALKYQKELRDEWS